MRFLICFLLIIGYVSATHSGQTAEESIDAFFEAANQHMSSMNKDIMAKIDEKNKLIHNEISSGKKAADIHDYINELIEQLINDSKDIVSGYLDQVNVLLKGTVKNIKEDLGNISEVEAVIASMQNIIGELDADIRKHEADAAASYKDIFHKYAEQIENEFRDNDKETSGLSRFGSIMGGIFNSVANAVSF